MLSVNVRSSGFSTWDFDQLTRLVIAAHDECVRVEVSPSNPKHIKITLWPRHGRNGSLSERHPTIEDAIADFRRVA